MRVLPAWSRRFSGEPFTPRLLVDSRGRVIVSTTRRAESRTMGGLRDMAITRMGAGQPTTYVNYHAFQAHAFEQDGTVAWVTDCVHIVGEAPDGTFVATNDKHQFLTVAAGDGRAHKARVRVPPDWNLIGWRGDIPVTSSSRGTVWVDPFVVSYADHSLNRLDLSENIVARTPARREEFDIQPRPSELAALPDALWFPSRLDLAYHPRLQQLIGATFAPLPWVAGFRSDGTIAWTKLAGEGCCNRTYVGGNRTIAHVSSCGGRVTFFSPEGAVIRAHNIGGLQLACAVDDRGAVLVSDSRTLYAFDADGEPLWSVEVPGIVNSAVSNDGRAYVLSDNQDSLELTAFDVG